MANSVMDATPAWGHQRAQNVAGWPKGGADQLRQAITRALGQ
jgi:hypothetical protein